MIGTCAHSNHHLDSDIRAIVCNNCGAWREPGGSKWTPAPVKAQTLPETVSAAEPDPVNHPPHYNSHPSGIEAIQVCEHFTFNIGNVIKYCWREGLKGDSIEDLKKARWYLNREIKKRKREAKEAKNESS